MKNDQNGKGGGEEKFPFVNRSMRDSVPLKSHRRFSIASVVGNPESCLVEGATPVVVAIKSNQLFRSLFPFDAEQRQNNRKLTTRTNRK